MINRISQEKGIVFNRKNNNKCILEDIVKKRYTHVFTSSKIALSKKFKNSVLDSNSFTYHFTFYIIDKIYLVKE